MSVPAVLPAPYAAPPSPHGLRASKATHELVAAQVRALLDSSPAYYAIEPSTREQISSDLTKVSAYTAELVREELYQSLKLGQRPMLRERIVMEGPALAAEEPESVARAQDFQSAAANQVGRVTRETLHAISFPTFVADLIRGTFQAIVNASIQQMEAYGALLANVSMTVDQFMADNISDHQARDWLAQRYPDHLSVQPDAEQGARLAPREGAEDRPPPNFRTDLGLPGDVALDESAIEETLVPAARRRLAQQRHSMLATMVMMGINRIVVTGGKIRATMGFHIDTSDRFAEQRATDLDTRVAASGSFGFGPWSASLSASVAYVTSERSQRSSEMNVEADLTSEVDIRFKSDYFPLERFVNPQGIQNIQSHTAVPDANAPSADALSPGALPDANPPPRARRQRAAAADPGDIRPIGTLPTAPAAPTAPTAPTVVRRVEAPTGETRTGQTPTDQTPTDQTPTDQTPTDQTPTDQTPTGQTPDAPADAETPDADEAEQAADAASAFARAPRTAAPQWRFL